MKKFVENTTNSPMYVGGVMIPPGEGVMVEVPDEHVALAPPPTSTLAEQVALLLKDPVKTIAATLEGLSDDALAMMSALEGGAANPRSTLLTAIGQEQIRRGDAALQAQQDSDRAEQLAQAITDLNAATAALDAEGDTDKHPAMEAAVSEARARVEALSGQAAG